MNLSNTLITSMILPLLSLFGLLGGLLLTYLAPEELTAGRRYFVLLYRIIFILLSFIITYFLSFPLLLLFLFLAIILLALDIKTLYIQKHHQSLFLIHYLFFLAGYFIAGKQTIIMVILFLYGLPVGTLLRMNLLDKK